jgi:tape measure domain-containing protein
VAVAVVDVQVNSQNAVRSLQQVNTASRTTQASLNNLQGAVTKLASSFAAIQAVRFVFAKTAEIETQTKSLQVLTGSVQQAKQIIQELQQLGAVTPFTSTELIDAAKRLQAFGVAGNQVVEVTRRLADASGATGAELQGLVTAYGQVVAKGRLQGEELLQFQERGVGLQQELQKMYRLSGEELQKALSKGQISARAVEIAFQRLTDVGGKYANGASAQSDTLTGKLSTLQDGVDALARRIGQVLTPALKAIFTQAIAVVDAINQALAAGRGGGFTRSVFGARQALNLGATGQAISNIAQGISQVNTQTNKSGIAQNLQALQQYQRLLQSIGPDDPNSNRAVQLQGVILQKIQQNIEAQKKLNTQAGGGSKIFEIPALGGAKDGKKAGKSDAERAAEAAAKERQRVAEVVRDRIAEGGILRINSDLQDKIAAAQAARDPMLAARLQGMQREVDLQYKYAQALAAEKDLRAQEAIIFEGNTALIANQRETQRNMAEIQRQQDQDHMDALKKHIEQQYELNTAVQQQKALADGIAGSLGQGLTSTFDLLIQGSQNWQQSLQQIASGVLVDIANQLLRIFVIEQAINSIRAFLTPFSPSTPIGAGGDAVGRFGTLGPNYGIPQRANGGSVMAGQGYLVGERGPELFMPGRSGGIAPTGSFGGAGNIVVNVDANGSNVQGDGAQANALGKAIGIAVQQELIKQKRPGGLLA